ncbi:Fc receptor-like protein 3 isoform X1 [Nelusetta ayraudi]|uniref:Fc receptor-like protein 3 isoform X1 n=1 Tax=Nelusetta ayraudi TaxID=303726 RepID=UPI003F700695
MTGMGIASKWIVSLLVLSAFPQLVITQGSSETSVRATVEIVVGDGRIFSGENVLLKCTIPDEAIWSYLWFKGPDQLPHSGQNLFLWKAQFRDSGTYYCQGVREATIKTQKSQPIEITVDGGWAILQASPQLVLVGQSVELTCRVHGTPPIHETILYKDGVEVLRQTGSNSQFNLTNLAMKDKGMYSCRASWEARRRTHSVLSAETPVQVLGSSETSVRATVEIVVGDGRIFSGENVLLKCTIPDEATWSYLWFKGSEQLPHSGQNLFLWKAQFRDSGTYYCQGVREMTIKTQKSQPIEITVDGGWAILQASPQLVLVGQSVELTCRVHGSPPLHETILYKDGVEVLRQTGSNSQFNLTNLAVNDNGMYSCRASWEARRRTHSVLSAETPVQVLEDAKHPITVNTQSPGQTTSLPATQTLPPTVKMAIPNTVSKFEASGDLFEESGDLSEVSGDMSEQSGDMP